MSNPAANNPLSKTCWFCQSNPPDQNSDVLAYLYKYSDFLDAYAAQIMALVATYVPDKIPQAIEAIQQSQTGSFLEVPLAMTTIETILNTPEARYALQQLKIKDYSETVGRVRFKPIAIAVPRCLSCRAAHRRLQIASRLISIPFGIATVISALGCIALAIGVKFSHDYSNNNFAAALLLGAITAGCGAMMSYNRKVLDRLFSWGSRPEEAKNEFPMVLDYVSKGWHLGKRPPNTR